MLRSSEKNLKTKLMLSHFNLKDSNMTHMSHIPIICMSCQCQEIGFIIKGKKAYKDDTRK